MKRVRLDRLVLVVAVVIIIALTGASVARVVALDGGDVSKVSFNLLGIELSKLELARNYDPFVVLAGIVMTGLGFLAARQAVAQLKGELIASATGLAMACGVMTVVFTFTNGGMAAIVFVGVIGTMVALCYASIFAGRAICRQSVKWLTY